MHLLHPHASWHVAHVGPIEVRMLLHTRGREIWILLPCDLQRRRLSPHPLEDQEAAITQINWEVESWLLRVKLGRAVALLRARPGTLSHPHRWLG